MHDIRWTFTIVVKTDSATGQPSNKDMEEILSFMKSEVEDALNGPMNYTYTIEKAKVTSDE